MTLTTSDDTGVFSFKGMISVFFFKRLLRHKLFDNILKLFFIIAWLLYYSLKIFFKSCRSFKFKHINLPEVHLPYQKDQLLLHPHTL